MGVGIVTDSTAYLPPGVAAELGITDVQVQVVVGGQSFDERDVSVARLAQALADKQIVTTSRPAPAEFETHYRRMHAAGCDEVVSIHLSRELSGTCEAALIAAGRVPFPVHVVDSQQVGMAMGFAVMRAAVSAREGLGGADIAAAATRDSHSALIAFSVDTLDYLQRGGRISGVQARIGGALHVKPILQMTDGVVRNRELARTSSKAVARLVDIARDFAAGPCDVAVHHVADEVRAYGLAAALGPALGVDAVPVTECGAVVGAHVGPGALAVVVSPR